MTIGADQTILQAAADAGLDLPASCHSGTCFTCPAKLVRGAVDQEESALDDDQMAAGYCLTCVSYPLEDLHVTIVDESEL